MNYRKLFGQSLIFFAIGTLGIELLSTSHIFADEGHKHADHGKGMEKMGQMEMHWMAPPEAAQRKNPISRNEASIERGKKIFKNNCIPCHGAEGKGDGPLAKTLNPKPVNLVMMAGMHPDGDFFWKISNGRNPMPAWKGILKEDQIWDTVNFIQSLSNPQKKKATHDHHSSKKHKH